MNYMGEYEWQIFYMEILTKILKIAYACVGVVGLIAYLPTIKDLYWHEKPSANTTSYIIWTVTSGITFLYSLFVLPDLLFRVVSGTNFGAIVLILILRVTRLSHPIRRSGLLK